MGGLAECKLGERLGLPLPLSFVRGFSGTQQLPFSLPNSTLLISASAKSCCTVSTVNIISAGVVAQVLGKLRLEDCHEVLG